MLSVERCRSACQDPRKQLVYTLNSVLDKAKAMTMEAYHQYLFEKKPVEEKINLFISDELPAIVETSLHR